MWLQKTATGFEHLQGLADIGFKTNYMTFTIAQAKVSGLLF
jgi:hypothetical protein